jgi:hypothetical protein
VNKLEKIFEATNIVENTYLGTRDDVPLSSEDPEIEYYVNLIVIWWLDRPAAAFKSVDEKELLRALLVIKRYQVEERMKEISYTKSTTS